MSDVDIEQKREEDERLDTAEDPNDEVRLPSMLRNHADYIQVPVLA
jgi:polyadenylate-binding protein 2